MIINGPSRENTYDQLISVELTVREMILIKAALGPLTNASHERLLEERGLGDAWKPRASSELYDDLTYALSGYM